MFLLRNREGRGARTTKAAGHLPTPSNPLGGRSNLPIRFCTRIMRPLVAPHGIRRLPCNPHHILPGCEDKRWTDRDWAAHPVALVLSPRVGIAHAIMVTAAVAGAGSLLKTCS